MERSLSNFMNAFTASDHTFYPFATTNEKDFRNLMSVYLDATLHPLLKESDFTQEGWRIGPKNPEAVSSGQADDESKQLVFKGVVYNEMKGQMSDAGYLYYVRYQDHIFPEIHNSGGDPQKMTDLTYEDLKRFHAEHYHPSNAKILTYGNMPLADHLVEVNRQLDVFDRIRADKAVKRPVKLDGPRNIVVKGPIDPLVDKDMQYKTSTAWIMGDTSDVEENFALGVMSSLLIDGYGSPLYRGLVESGLGPDWSPNTGYDTAGKTGIFCIGLNGVKEENVPKVKEAIQTVFEEMHQKGFDQGKIDGILHQLELALKHKTANFGMNLMQRLKPSWFNGVDPFDALQWNKTVATFKERLAQGGYLESLLKKYLLNDRTLTFTMEPSINYGENIVREESERLASKIENAAAEFGGETQAQEELAARELELVELQNKARSENLSSLPMVHVKDIPREMERKSIRDSNIGDVKIQWREANTNGLTYFRAINTLAGLPEELRMLIPLFNDSLMRLGTKDKTMEQLEDLIKLKTGGIKTSYFATGNPKDINLVSEGISLSGYALDRNVPDMYELLRIIIQETNFDGPNAENMIRQLLQSDANGALDAVARSGHGFAMTSAEATLMHQGLLAEQTKGLTQVRNVTSLASRSSEQGLQDIIAKLKAIQELAISNSANLRAAITCGPESTTTNESAISKFLSGLPSSTETPKPPSSPPSTVRNSKTFFPLPYQVYYSALSIPTIPYIHPSTASLQILSHLLRHKHIHHEVREKGGAYGGGAYSKGLKGIFGFYSYRDPNPENTLKVVSNAGRWARDKNWTNEDLEAAKLSVFQGLDAPESVSEEGMTRFLSGIDEVMEQKMREQLLDVTNRDVKEAAEQFVVQGMNKASVAILGEKKDWVKESEGWKIEEINV